jgi:hypothetical protein
VTTRRKPTSSLPAVTALLVFLAKHPHLAELPLSWDIRNEEDGYEIWVEAEHHSPDGGKLLTAVGKALRTPVTDREFVSSSSGQPTTIYTLSGSTGGVSVSGTAYILTALLGGAE